MSAAVAIAAVWEPVVADAPLPSLLDIFGQLHCRPDIPNEVYHADRSCVSVSGLKEILRSPAHFQAYLQGANRKETSAMFLGTAVHTRLLEPHLYASEYVVAPISDKRLKAYKEFEIANANKKILTPDQMAVIEGIAQSVSQHTSADTLLRAGLVEHSIIWQDEETGIWLKIRPDCLCVDFDTGICLDVKKTTDASKQAFKWACDRYHQLLALLLGREIPLPQRLDKGLGKLLVLFGKRGAQPRYRIVEVLDARVLCRQFDEQVGAMVQHVNAMTEATEARLDEVSVEVSGQLDERLAPLAMRMVYMSSRPWVGWAWRPSPALTTCTCGAQCCAIRCGAPLSLWRTTNMSACIADRLAIVSSKLSPLLALLLAMSRLMTSALKRLAAISKVVRVRVLFSKNRLNTLLPRNNGTFLTSRSLTLRKVLAVSRICVNTACGSPSIDSRWISSPLALSCGLRRWSIKIASARQS